ncbi:MAG TPA: hypothetical protein VM537_26770 [Anaerolineae bacterium]|nr:hypothetical protein [Anaerolineae bacterium]
MKLSDVQKRVLRTMERIAAEEIQVVRPKGGLAFYCTKKDQSLRGPHWRTLCAMVAQAAPWGKIEWYCPICDWGWSSPDEALEAMTHAIQKAARAVFGKEAAGGS